MPHRAVRVGAIAAAMFALVLTVAGCSSHGRVTDPIASASPVRILVPSPSGTASAKVVESSDTVLRADLLTLSDLPTGWKQDTSAGVVGGSSCEAMSDPAYDRLPLHVAADFSASAGLPALTEILAYGTTAQVDAAWTSYVKGMTLCGRLTMRSRGQTLPLVLRRMPFLRTGNPTDARQAVTTRGTAASVCLILIRKGDLLESVTYTDGGMPGTSVVQNIVEDADSKTALIR